MKRLLNDQMMYLEKNISVKYREIVEDIRLREYFQKTYFNVLDIHEREGCYIEGISEQTLRNWHDKARADGIVAPGKDALSDD